MPLTFFEKMTCFWRGAEGGTHAQLGSKNATIDVIISIPEHNLRVMAPPVEWWIRRSMGSVKGETRGHSRGAFRTHEITGSMPVSSGAHSASQGR